MASKSYGTKPTAGTDPEDPRSLYQGFKKGGKVKKAKGKKGKK